MAKGGTLKHCPNPDCGAVVSGETCWNCGTFCFTVDPIVKLRRRCEDSLRKSKPEIIVKVAEVLGVR